LRLAEARNDWMTTPRVAYFEKGEMILPTSADLNPVIGR
jgi:hypothetical protein